MSQVSGFITSIRNAIQNGQAIVEVPFSKLCMDVGAALTRRGYLWSVERVDADGRSQLRVAVKYDQVGGCAIREIRSVSKPGCRVYQGVRDLRPVLQGFGTAVVSTNKGVITDAEARDLGVGGEVVCLVW